MPSHVTIQSALFQSCFLRLNGTGVSHRIDQGQGEVNCQTHAAEYELLELTPIPEAGPGVFAIGSVQFPNVYLYMDGRGVKGKDSSRGKVALQYGHFGWEHFRFVPQPNGTTAIQSVEFPDSYLRMNGYDLPSGDSTPGYGEVTCQGVIGDYERFIVLPAGFKTS